MTKKKEIFWCSPKEIEVFTSIVEQQIPSISITKIQKLHDFIVATREGAMGILIYPEILARQGDLWLPLSKLTRENPNVIVFESDTFCKPNNITGNINQLATPGEIMAAIKLRLATLVKRTI